MIQNRNIQNDTITPAKLADATEPVFIVRLATTANIVGTYNNAPDRPTYTVTTAAALSIDSVAVAVGDLVLSKDLAETGADGVYRVEVIGNATTSPVLRRILAMNKGDDASGSFCLIKEGTVNADTFWVCTDNAGSAVVGTNDLTFSQSGAAGMSYAVAGTIANVTKAAAAAGTSATAARGDHKHDVTTAAPAATGVATAAAEGTATSVARTDHAHQSNTVASALSGAAATVGSSGEPARADHGHGIASYASGGTTPALVVFVGKNLNVDVAGNSDIVLVLPAASTWQVEDSWFEQETAGNVADNWQLFKLAAAIGSVVAFSATDGAVTRLGAIPLANKAYNSFANGDTLRWTTVDGSAGAGDVRGRFKATLRRLT